MLAARVMFRSASTPVRNSLAQQARRYRPSPAPSTPSLLSSSWKQPQAPRWTAAFSTSRQHQERQKPVMVQLTAKLESELAMEKQMRDPDSLPSHLKEFLDNSDFELQDIPGKEEVIMTRKHGDETIRISFSIDDLNNPDEDPDQMQEDTSMMDEMDDDPGMPTDTQSGGASPKGAINQDGNVRVAPEDSVAPADRSDLTDEEGMDGEEEEEPPSFTSHCYITIERPSKGALQIEAMAQDGLIVIENVYFYKDAKLVDPKTRDDENAVRDLYTGPPFGNLDEDLQLLFERYLEERGVNSTLALFVPEYIDFKEQREYTNWLSGVKSFFE